MITPPRNVLWKIGRVGARARIKTSHRPKGGSAKKKWMEEQRDDERNQRRKKVGMEEGESKSNDERGTDLGRLFIFD